MPNPKLNHAEAAAFRNAGLVIFAASLFRLGLAALLDPAVDEAYAMAVAKNWQLSWFDHPPMVFWWVKGARELAQPILGNDVPVFVLRLPFVLAFTITSAVMFDLTRRIFGSRAGMWMVLALSLAPFFTISVGSWLVPDGPLVLFLSITAWLLHRILFADPAPGNERFLWVAAGLTLGLAGLSKYHAVIFALSAVVFILGTPHRQRLASAGPWLGVAICGLVVSPVFIWNARHDWVSFLFQSSRGAGSDGPSWSGLAGQVFGQMIYLGPWTLIAALAAAIALLWEGRTRAGSLVFLATLGLPPIILFSAVPLLGGDALPHWPMPGWLFLLPILGRAIASSEVRRDQPHNVARRFALAGATVLAILILAVTGIRYKPPSSGVIAGLGLNTFLEETYAWRGIADDLAARGLLTMRTPLTAEEGSPLVAAFSWVDAARLADALGPKATVAVFNDDPRGFAFLADQADWVGHDVLLLGRPDAFARGLKKVRPHFTRIDRLPPVAVQIGNEILFEAEVAIGRDLTSPYPLPYPKR